MKKKEQTAADAPEILDIPADEIWTYRIEGLQEPHIGAAHNHSTGKKILVIAVLLASIGLSIFLSARAVHKQTFQYKALGDGTYELVKFNNPGDYTSLTVDYVDGDTSRPITALHEYFLNCDEMLVHVKIGKDVTQIDGKSFYSCSRLQNIYVDRDNPAYCDLDGVLYTKDLSTIVCYPIDHSASLRERFGYADVPQAQDGAYDEKYIGRVLTYRLPPETTTIGMLAFNYSDLADVYLPEGLRTIETMAFFRCTNLRNLYSFRGADVCLSFPDGLQTIGSDAFSYDQALKYVFIPAGVTQIGHHAFWDTVYGSAGALEGVTAIDAARSKEDFKQNVRTGDQWRPEYTRVLFKKAVDVHYGAERMDAHAAS